MRKSYWVLILVALLFSCNKNSRKEEKPNVILIMTDDQGYGDFGFTGNDVISTPTLDALATNNILFDNFHVSPVCAPTRASLLTGKDHLRTGTTWVTHRKEVMRSDEFTLAEMMHDQGYATGIFGKWHNGSQYPNNPMGQGFDEFFGFAAGHWNNYFDTELQHNNEMVPTKGYITDVLTDKALEFIDAHHEGPFFCYIPYNAPHSPLQVPDSYFNKYKSKGLNDKDAAVYGMCENIDDNINRILQHLESIGIRDNTIIIFLTDNGPNGERYNGGMKGWKGSVHEGGVRVPLIISWPGKFNKPAKFDQLTAHIDILPTIADMLGISLPDSLEIDGKSLWPIMNGKTKWNNRSIFTHQVRRNMDTIPGAIRTDSFRFVLYDKSTPELYNMIEDPGQKNNIADENQDIITRLSAEYDLWFQDATSQGVSPEIIEVGHKESKETVVFAPEFQFSGGIIFSKKWGWANDWVTNWSGSGDSLYFRFKVVNPATFEIGITYNCPEEQAGSGIVARIDGYAGNEISIPGFTGDIIPSPDRVPRGEVYEKGWGKLKLGIFELSEGEHTFSLSASFIAARQVGEIKSVYFEEMD